MVLIIKKWCFSPIFGSLYKNAFRTNPRTDGQTHLKTLQCFELVVRISLLDPSLHAAPQQLAVELLNVCHRLLLTRENLHLQNQVVKVVKLVLVSATLWTEDLRKAVSNDESSAVEDSTDENKEKTVGNGNKIAASDDGFSDDDDFQAFQGDDDDDVDADETENLKTNLTTQVDGAKHDEFDVDDDFQKFETVEEDQTVPGGEAEDVAIKNAFKESAPPPGFDVGEGGANGDEMEAGKSVVFATLEVCLCALLRQIPALNPQAPQTGIFHPC